MQLARDATLSAQVSVQVRTWLRRGELAPGKLYSVQQIADRLGVSRSPVREALLALAETGLIEFTRNRGFRLVVPSAHDVAEIFAIRLALEPQAARRSAVAFAEDFVPSLQLLIDQMGAAADAGDTTTFAQLDQQFHAGIMVGACNLRAANVVGQLRDFTRSLGPSTAGESRTLRDILEEHVPILDAIRDRDPARAHLSMRRHLVRTGQLLMQQCERSGEAGAWRSWELLVDQDQ